MSTKLRGHQVRPTKAEVDNAWIRIRSAADAGDLQASALLVALAEKKPILQLPAALIAGR